MPVAHRWSELCPFSAAFLGCLWKSPGLSTVGCWACLHRVCLLLCSGQSCFFSPVSVSSVAAEGAGNFWRAQSHHQPSPASLGSPRMRGMAPAWLWLLIFVAAPARVCLLRGPPYPTWPWAHARIDGSLSCPSWCRCRGDPEGLGLDGVQRALPTPTIP